MTRLTSFRGVLQNVGVICCALLLLPVGCAAPARQSTTRSQSIGGPPSAISMTALTLASPDEEVRAMFVTTAYNADWPSQPGLPKNVQQNEMDAAIIRAKELNCNTIFLQVRSFG